MKKLEEMLTSKEIECHCVYVNVCKTINRLCERIVGYNDDDLSFIGHEVELIFNSFPPVDKITEVKNKDAFIEYYSKKLILLMNVDFGLDLYEEDKRNKQ